MSEALVRDRDVVTTTVEERSGTGQSETREPVNDAATGVALDRTIFVPGGTDLQGAIDSAGPNSHIVALNGTPFDGHFYLMNDQTLQGGGSDLDVVGRMTNTPAVYSAPGSTPTLQYLTGAAAGSPVLQVRNNDHVIGINVRGAGNMSRQFMNHGIIGDPAGVTNVFIDQTLVHDTGGDGIRLASNNSLVRISQHRCDECRFARHQCGIGQLRPSDPEREHHKSRK